jgi:uncharacterized protein (TIGR03435 family)
MTRDSEQARGRSLRARPETNPPAKRHAWKPDDQIVAMRTYEPVRVVDPPSRRASASVCRSARHAESAYARMHTRLVLEDTVVVKLAILLLVSALAGYGQTVAEPAQYEVASIKPNTSDDVRVAFRIESDGAVAATGITLKRLMMTAFNVQGFRIVGGPGWVASRRWDLQAKHDSPIAPNQIRTMLRALLEERFQLRSHSEIRTMPVYELVVDRKGSKVPRPKGREAKETVQVAAGSIRLTNATSATFASQLSYALGAPVINKTSLSGQFDFAIDWTPTPGEDGGPTTSGLPPGTREQSAATADGPSIFTSVREQLGLRLKSGRGPVEVVVIDDVEMPGVN